MPGYHKTSHVTPAEDPRGTYNQAMASVVLRFSARIKFWNGLRQPCLIAEARSYGTRQESKQWRQKPNRNARLSVILNEDVHNLGVKGQIVEVKHGYGRNYLLPKGMAVYVTPNNVSKYDAFTVDKGASSLNEVDFLTDFLSEKTLRVEHDPDSKSAIYEQHISRAFQKDLQLHVPVDCIELEEPITDFNSEHCVGVRLDEATTVKVPLRIELVLTNRKKRILDKQKRIKEAKNNSVK